MRASSRSYSILVGKRHRLFAGWAGRDQNVDLRLALLALEPVIDGWVCHPRRWLETADLEASARKNPDRGAIAGGFAAGLDVHADQSFVTWSFHLEVEHLSLRAEQHLLDQADVIEVAAIVDRHNLVAGRRPAS